MKLTWTRSAAQQLENIFIFLENKSELAAVEVYNDILDEADRLLLFPNIAPLEPLLAEFSEGYRSLTIRNIYKLVYYTDKKNIFIAAVFDCRQSPEKLEKMVERKKQT